jgi:hypothetical protein
MDENCEKMRVLTHINWSAPFLFPHIGCSVVSSILHSGRRNDRDNSFGLKICIYSNLRGIYIYIYIYIYILQPRFHHVNSLNGCDQSISSEKGKCITCSTQIRDRYVMYVFFVRVSPNMVQWHSILGISTYSRLISVWFVLLPHKRNLTGSSNRTLSFLNDFFWKASDIYYTAWQSGFLASSRLMIHLSFFSQLILQNVSCFSVSAKTGTDFICIVSTQAKSS